MLCSVCEVGSLPPPIMLLLTGWQSAVSNYWQTEGLVGILQAQLRTILEILETRLDCHGCSSHNLAPDCEISGRRTNATNSCMTSFEEKVAKKMSTCGNIECIEKVSKPILNDFNLHQRLEETHKDLLAYRARACQSYRALGYYTFKPSAPTYKLQGYIR